MKPAALARVGTHEIRACWQRRAGEGAMRTEQQGGRARALPTVPMAHAPRKRPAQATICETKNTGMGEYLAARPNVAMASLNAPAHHACGGSARSLPQ